MNDGLKVFGLAAVMGLVGCMGGEGSVADVGTTRQALTAATSEVHVPICEGDDVPVDPFTAEWLARPGTTFREMKASTRTRPDARMVAADDAVISEIAIHGFDPQTSKDAAKLTLKLASASESQPASVWLTCTTSTVDTTTTQDAGIVLSVGADSVTGTFDVTLDESEAAGLEGHEGELAAARIDRVPRNKNRAPKEILVVGSRFESTASVVLDEETTSLVIVARLRGLKKIEATSSSPAAVVATLAYDSGDDGTVTARLLNNKNPELTR
jgi:hypothetical protein